MKMEIGKIDDHVNQHIVVSCLHQGIVVSFQVVA